MTKSEYIGHFSQNAKWKLSYQEAEEVIEDYEGFFSQSGRDEHDICLELGNPTAAVKALSSRMSYGYWLTIFSIQAIALFVPYFILLASNPPLSFILSHPDVNPHIILTLAGFGVMVSLVFFRPQKKYLDKKIPKTIFFSLVVLFLFAFILGILVTVFFYQLYDTNTIPFYSLLLPSILFLSGTLFTAAGIWSLIKSRICDRRWRAVYILALTLLLITISIFDLLTSLDIKNNIFHIVIQELQFDAVMGGIGILACGGSLC